MAGKIVPALCLGSLLLSPPLAAQSSNGSSDAGSQSEEARVFMGAFETILQHHMSAIGDSALWERAIEGLISALDDPYATVFTPEEYDEFREETTGDYAGIGVQISGLDGGITITTVFRDTPAEKAGLLVGDRIVGVNGASTEGWSTADASEVIRGKPGTNVRVGIRRDGLAEPVPYVIKRANVHVTAVRSGLIEGEIGYIHLERVARGSAGEVGEAVSDLNGARAIVLDLRRNPGGYMDESLRMADLFLDKGLSLATIKSRATRAPAGEVKESYRGRMSARAADKPIIILVDRFTASAAEIITGALQDHDRALVIGERTFGKGVVQTLMPLPGNRQIRITTGAWYTPLGRSLQRHRTSSGELLEEHPDSFPVFVTGQGRQVKGGGGIFPDLEVAEDTLTLAERGMLNAAARAEVPVTVRLAEFALEVAKQSLAEGIPPDISEAEFIAFFDELLEEGLPLDALDAEGVRDYLRWRVRVGAAERVGDFGLSATYRMDRDPVLTEAIRLLTATRSQEELFALVDQKQRTARQLGSRVGR